jgi:hypothetical protein
MKIKNITLTFAAFAASAFIASPVYAAPVSEPVDTSTTTTTGGGDCSEGVSSAACNKVCEKITDPVQRSAAGCDMTSSKEDKLPTHLQAIINTAIAFVGIVAVLVIVFAGQRLVSGGGNPDAVKRAKDMILYAIVAIVVAVLSWAIINFVVGALGK